MYKITNSRYETQSPLNKNTITGKKTKTLFFLNMNESADTDSLENAEYRPIISSRRYIVPPIYWSGST